MVGVFCDHRRVRTICPECKPRPQPPPAEQRVMLPSGAAPAALPSAPDEEAELVTRGPGKPLLPNRKRARKVTAADVASAEAWWVKRD